MPILGVDISHFQGSPNFAQVKASGRSFVVLKATESTNFVDITCNGGYDVLRKVQVPSNRAAAHAAGLIVGLYHFARAGNPATEAAWFVHTVGTLQPGEFLVLDWEVPAADPVGWCRAWLAAVTAATGVKPLIYMNSSAMNGSNWTPITSDFGLWLARYDGVTTQPTVKWWPAAAMKQFSDRGTVPGIAGTCDVDVFYGTTAQLLAYGKGGSTPTPPPAPPSPPALGAPDMRLARTPDGTIWLVTDEAVTAIGDPDTFASLRKVWGDPIAVEQADITRLNAACVAPGTLSGDLRGDLKNKGEQLDALAAAVTKLQSGGVDAAQVAALVLAGIKAQMSADVPPAPPA